MLSLRFEGVYYAARVWLNGVYLGDHEGYFSAFEFDVTDIVVTGGGKERRVGGCRPHEAEEEGRQHTGSVCVSYERLVNSVVRTYF